MTKLIPIENTSLASDAQYCNELESGNILFFSAPPFDFPQEDLKFLLQQKQTGASNRKNIAYKPQINRISNYIHSSPTQEMRLLEIMKNYSSSVVGFLQKLLPPYASKWKLDYASFRPFQELGRNLRTRARNDLLHTDAFPTRPLHGDRILRFFTNINPQESRKWTTSLNFEQLVEQFGAKEVPFPQSTDSSLLSRFLFNSKKIAKSCGLPITLRSPYDVFMLNMHNFMKENAKFQATCPKDHWEFPPNSCWIVYTDFVSHAAISGQYALEQTLIIPSDAMVLPEKSPLHILEAKAKRSLL